MTHVAFLYCRTSALTFNELAASAVVRETCIQAPLRHLSTDHGRHKPFVRHFPRVSVRKYLYLLTRVAMRIKWEIISKRISAVSSYHHNHKPEAETEPEPRCHWSHTQCKKAVAGTCPPLVFPVPRDNDKDPVALLGPSWAGGRNQGLEAEPNTVATKRERKFCVKEAGFPPASQVTQLDQWFISSLMSTRAACTAYEHRFSTVILSTQL